MQVQQETPNKNFQEAFEYVDRNYAYLIRESFLRSITLLDGPNHEPGADGLHMWYESGRFAMITVRNEKQYSTAHYVDVLVHELTHLVQCSSGRVKSMTTAQMEREAYPAGRNARRLFELREMEGLASAMKAATVAAQQRRWAA
jgi:hypothetical protein